jgi:hypothetical protein
VALTSLCERSLATTADTPIALFPIRNKDEPKWQKCHEAMCDLTSPHFSTGSAEMDKYSRYLFNLQHNISRTVIEQRGHLNAYAEQAIHMSRMIERLERKNALLGRGTRESTEKDLELPVAYHHLSKAEHWLNYARQ